MNLHQRISGLSIRDRITLGMKVSTLFIAAIAALGGRPPSNAQTVGPWTTVPVSGEDIKQDGDIAFMKSGLDTNKQQLDKLTDIVIALGKEQASQGTKMTDFAWLICAIVGGQIGIQVYSGPKTKKKEDKGNES